MPWRRGENAVYSEQDVNNVLLIKYEATHREDSVAKIMLSSVRGKNRSRAIMCACLTPELVCRASDLS